MIGKLRISISRSDKECPGSQKCENGFCKPYPCSKTSDCQPFEKCNEEFGICFSTPCKKIKGIVRLYSDLNV